MAGTIGVGGASVLFCEGSGVRGEEKRKKGRGTWETRNIKSWVAIDFCDILGISSWAAGRLWIEENTNVAFGLSIYLSEGFFFAICWIPDGISLLADVYIAREAVPRAPVCFHHRTISPGLGFLTVQLQITRLVDGEWRHECPGALHQWLYSLSRRAS